MHFTNPIWLWGFTGLLIPVIIHLLSRKPGKVVPIGSIRFLRESNTARFRSIGLNEIPLLLLRCALIILVVLLLSGLELPLEKEKKFWLLIEQGLEKDPRLSTVIDSLREEGFTPRYFAEGFPPLSDRQPDAAGTSYWGLIESLVQEETDSSIVISYGYARAFKGRRIPLPENIRWISVEPDSARFLARVTQYKSDSVWIREGFSSSERTWFSDVKTGVAGLSSLAPAEIEDAPRLHPADSITIGLYAEPEFEYDARVMRAILRTLEESGPNHLSVVTLQNSSEKASTDWLIWFSDKPVPDPGETKIIRFSACAKRNLPMILNEQEAHIACPDTHPASWVITKRLHEETVLQENLVIEFGEIILPTNAKMNPVHDKRVAAESVRWSRRSPQGKDAAQENTLPVHEYLMVLIILTLLAERRLSLKRNQ